MSGPSTFVPQSALGRWFESRLPIGGLVHSSFIAYPTPRNLNYFWTFGAILSFMLVAQIITGIVLAMHYTPHVDHAFQSVEHIMRDVNWGWFMRYSHANGASMFFIAVYIHMFRGLYYGSYKAPREVLWILGVVIFLVMMATAFMGYVLPWGQMSFWGATVITNLFSAIPLVGDAITTWLWGGYSVDNPTLNRFFALHYLMPFMLIGVVILHVWALHVSGQNNPTGVEVKNVQRDTLPFTPFATVKDSFALVMFLIFFSWWIFYVPNYLGHADNYIEANPLVTPAHIVNGISCRSTRSCAPSPPSSVASSRCSVRLRSSRSCPGLIRQRYVRPIIAPFIACSSSCSCSPALALAIWALCRQRAVTCSPRAC
jgi:ubiquinol-cytochrome c reductase cytochrome b subunit